MHDCLLIPGGVTAPAGFCAGAAAAEIKYKSKKDVAVLYSEAPAVAAGVFTKNIVKAAPVLVSMKHLTDGQAQGVVINSGNANACNGEQGLADANAMVNTAAEALGIEEELVLVASTGVIGQPMPMERVLSGVKDAVAAMNPSGGNQAAEAIMTTDTVLKETACEITLGGCKVRIGGMAKGSGMIHPDMATMLCFITTDAAILPSYLRQALRQAVDNSFNMISVDRDTSTNDTAVIMANGLAGNPVINGDGDDYRVFRDALTEVCVTLAKSMAQDGEGATKLIQVTVRQAPTLLDARLVAKAVISSNLVKAAVFGKDANWGRIICAAGYSGADFQPDAVDIFLGDEMVANKGCAVDFSEERAFNILSRDSIEITVDLHQGSFEATAWGCDLTYDYVRINGDYRT
ncbi:MAG: bifunctional glutamate N-acetyltransferase/amino-acid acetyltransferase ArgJ [Peptococcaceae bacterium]|nr:bifunctional glutamate N-acetyltransferase/amino-acid acetyltransferase ArgJ [Peptococcaceae bacterium]